MKRITAFCIAIGLLLSGCAPGEADRPGSEPPGAASIELPAASEQASPEEPVNAHSQSFEESVARFVSLLEYGGLPDSVYYFGIDAYYTQSYFCGVPVKVNSIQEIETEQSVRRFDAEYKTYQLELSIPKVEESPLSYGAQSWILILCNVDYIDLYYGIDRFLTASKYEAWLAVGQREDIGVLLDHLQLGTAFTLFDSPAELPAEKRGCYLLANVPTARENGFLTLEVADDWAGRIFGVQALDRSIRYDWCEDLEAYGVLSYQSLGSPYVSNNFIAYQEGSGQQDYIYEYFDDALHVMPSKKPDMVLCYTVKDGMVFSVTDITNTYEISSSLDELISNQRNVITNMEDSHMPTNSEYVSLDDQMRVLKDCGFTVINEEALANRIQEIRDDWNAFLGTTDYFERSPYTELFMAIAQGDIDTVTGEHTEFSTNIYGFDTECIDGETPYTSILKNLERFSDGILVFDNIREKKIEGDDRAYSLELSVNGKEHHWQSGPLNGWFDGSLLDFLNTVLEKDNCNKRIYTMFEDQGVSIVFLTPEENEDIFMKTGIRFGVGSKFPEYADE